MNMNGRTHGYGGEGGQVSREVLDSALNNYGVLSQSTSSPWDTPPPQDYTSAPQLPLWDTNLSDPSCAWDLNLSQQLANKLLLDSREEQREDLCIEQSQAPSNPRFKTEICRNFKEKGVCVYGGLCQFAHGKHELRQDVVRHTRYKTKLCQKYWIAGYCAYGPRCNFVHQEMEKHVRGGRDFNPEVTTTESQPSAAIRRVASGEVTTTQTQPSAVIRRAASVFTKSRQTLPSTLVRNVSDVIRISKLGSQEDSGGDSGSELVGANNGVWRGSPGPQGPLLEKGYSSNCLTSEEQLFAANRPIGSERYGKRTLWPGV